MYFAGSRIVWLDRPPSYSSHDIGVKTEDQSIIQIDYTGIYWFGVNLCMCCGGYCRVNGTSSVAVYQRDCLMKRLHISQHGTLSSGFLLLLKKGNEVHFEVENVMWMPRERSSENSLDIVFQRLVLLEAMYLDKCQK